MPTDIQRLAGLARAAQLNAKWISIEEGIGAEARAPIMRLSDALVETYGAAVGGRIMSKWFVCHLPIDVCVAEVKAEPPEASAPQPWGLGAPSALGRRSRAPRRYQADRAGDDDE